MIVSYHRGKKCYNQSLVLWYIVFCCCFVAAVVALELVAYVLDFFRWTEGMLRIDVNGWNVTGLAMLLRIMSGISEEGEGEEGKTLHHLSERNKCNSNTL